MPPDSQIKVRVLFFGAARDAVGREEIDFELSRGADSAAARTELLTAYPALRHFGKSLLFAVNKEYAEPDRKIYDGDELAIFPPVSGGAGKAENDFFELTTGAIDVGQVARRVV